MAVTIMILATLGHWISNTVDTCTFIICHGIAWDAARSTLLFTWHKLNKDQCGWAEFDDDQKVADIFFFHLTLTFAVYALYTV
jgi:hypothetical protein